MMPTDRASRLIEADQPGPTQEEVNQYDWWHTFVFPNGVKAAGAKDQNLLKVEAQCAFKFYTEGKTVLDVGANNGYFSVEAVRRGAKRVLALENEGWNGVGFQQFKLVRGHLAPQIETLYLDVMNLRSVPIEAFDFVLFMGVLYHLRHPLYALEILYDLTREQLVVETHIDGSDYDRPAMVFYPGSELNADPSNWWGPNIRCVTDMLKTVGFARIDYLPHPRAPRRGFFFAFK